MPHFTVYPTFVGSPNIALGDECQYILSHETNAASFSRVDFKGDSVHIVVARDFGQNIVLVEYASAKTITVGRHIVVEMYYTQDAEGIVDQLLTAGEVDASLFTRIPEEKHASYLS
jgi:hypothetical protein